MDIYKKTIHEIFDLQKFAIKLGLQNISKLTEYLDNPHKKYPTIHVAGTNGKGSTAILIQKILSAHGLKVGLFISPHLISYNERIRINDNFIDDRFIIDFWKKMKPLVMNLKATFFDTTTCIAFFYFYKMGVDVAIFETGLGGRLDSTNIINPEVAVITPIDFDHQKQLGNTLTNIAKEKAGIIKDGCTLFLGKQKMEVDSFFKSHKSESNKFVNLDSSINNLKIKSNPTETVFSFRDVYRDVYFKNLKLKLLGRHQVDNTCLAYLTATWYLEELNIQFNENKF